ncbi:hypothetical protein GQX73_g7633 [Xylaria multiplex]|uniref:Transcription factor domain-containing protein n=1 Tax=Xylaria multiplex TaxID=323545 RepID=A0A7C8ITA5_9PEZI|nr:hypothetical protein GQX73_g7633 [Xylaria multiplex]
MEPIDFNNQSTALPLLTLGSNNAEFDYAAYLQDDEVDYLGDAGSSGSASVMNEVASASVSPSTPSAIVKSNSSQKPSVKKLDRRVGTALRQVSSVNIRSFPRLLINLQDMRFFQHFLLTCSPHHPLGNDSIWTHEVPCLSQNHEYLMHAILGLAASDLMVHDPSLVTFAMAHRLKAIKAIKKTLTDVPKTNTFEEGNALLATCYALTFQSVMLDDGMAEFMTFCRGIVIVAIQMYCKGATFIFSNFLGDDQMVTLQPLMESIPPIQKEWTDMAVGNIAALEPLCKQQVEIEYHQLITNIANALYASSFLAYQLLCKHYRISTYQDQTHTGRAFFSSDTWVSGWWMQIPHENFQSLIDGGNQVCLLLASHWIALKQIMAKITGVEHRQRPQQPGRKDGDMDLGMVRWLKYINRQVDVDHQRYNQWPLWVEAQLDIDLGYFGKDWH